MKMEKLAVGLTAINITLLLMAAVHAKSAAAPDTVTHPELQLVDDKGQVRSRLNMEVDGTVVLRMFDEKGTIRVKLGADKAGSGLVLLDESTEPGVHIVARGKGETGIKLQGAEGQQRVIEP